MTGSGAKMWGGRFERAPDASFYAFERSFAFDCRLLPWELALDRAWAKALVPARILTSAECDQILSALAEIERRAKTDPGWLDGSTAEDVHDFVEQALVEQIGAAGAKLHTGRSRNEMIATEFRMFVRAASVELRVALAEMTGALAAQAEQQFGVPMPGMTHLQHAQPLLVSHWLLAHAEAFARDAERAATAALRADACPMGSGALAGCAFPVDRAAIARELGFSRITANSLDAVSDRDFALEYLSALSMLAVHLSRLAEDFILYASDEYGFVRLPDEYSTGSSLMPQKKNPDVWELIRGKAGRITGALVGLLVTLKGLPSSYQRDLQEDKEPVFSAHDQALAMTRMAAGAVAATGFDAARLRAAASDPALLATEAADFLVERGVPFRQAHEAVGKLIRAAEEEGRAWTSLTGAELEKFSPSFAGDLHGAFTVEAALARRNLPGGTGPDAVRRALAELRGRVARAGGER